MKKKYLIIIYALILSYCNAFAQIPTDSLVAYYPFNGNANDSSGNGFNGFLNGQTPVGGICGFAYQFYGNFISCGDPVSNDFDLINNASISLWIYLYSVPSGQNGYYTLIGKDVGPGNHDKWILLLYNSVLVFHINVEALQGGGFWAIQPIFLFAPNTFYNIVVTKSANTYIFYVNGSYYGLQTLTQNIVDVASPLRIGDLQDGSSTFNGVIDEVLIYHKALTQLEINRIFAHCPGVVTSSGTIVQDESSEFRIYPNPSSGQFVLSFTDLPAQIKNVFVYNILGEKVFVRQPQIYNQNVMIDLGHKPKGVYLLQVQTRKKIITRKIIIE